MQAGTRFESVLRRERAVVAVGLFLVTAMAWAYLVYMAMSPSGMDMATARVASWTRVDFGLMFVMWAVMMVAMMVPSAAPMVMMFASMNRRRRQDGLPFVSTGVFLVGYLSVWSGFATVATLVQWGLHQATLLSSTMGNVTPHLGGALLLIAGVYQWTPLKNACLGQCRTPIGFLLSEWRDGNSGAVVMGIRHGTSCLGCCWFLMVLMLVGGVMNLVWMAGVATYILAEKVVPAGHWFARAVGLLLVGWGAVLLVWGASPPFVG